MLNKRNRKRNVVLGKKSILAIVFLIIVGIGMSVVSINGQFSCSVNNNCRR